jgi:gliding motility-associated-like protein
MPITLDASKSTGVGPLSFSWAPGDYLSDATLTNPVFTPGESTTYSLTLTDALGNIDTRTVKVLVDPMPDVVTDKLVFVSNAGESVMLDASESVGSSLSYSWSSSGSGVLVSGGDTATPEVKGTGKYYVTITDQYGCMDRDSVIVGIWIQAVDDKAEALINNYVAINVLQNDIPQGNIDVASVAIVVPPANGSAEVRTDSTIIYTPNTDFIGEDEFIYQVCDYLQHCDEATVLVMVSEEALFIPNAFTPNGDGYNDLFEIKGLANYEHVRLKVFNRWGNLVYESVDYGGADGFWDGVANYGVRIGKGPVPTGVYFYSLYLGKGEKQLSGFIYIDR